MPKIPEGKTTFLVYIDKELLDKFKRMAFTKFTKLRGSLNDATIEAIKMWIENEEKHPARTHIFQHEQANHNSRTIKNLKTITAKILEYSNKEIPQTMVERFITETAGGESRTLHRYIFLLSDYGVLKPLRPIIGTKKMIFEVDIHEAKKLVGLPI